MADDLDRTKKGILGDINPNPSTRDHMAGHAAPNQARAEGVGEEDDTERTAGAAGVGGTRNYRTTGGASGSDIGNRPE